MGLSGLEIYKLLPKTNCKECGQPTCLAFAMKLAAKQAELSACPYVSEESKAALAAASAPPIRLITLGSDNFKIEVGNETVMFRHEKTFYHEPALMVRLKDTISLGEFEAQVKSITEYQVERVGIQLAVNGLAIENVSGDAGLFGQYVAAARAITSKPFILMAKGKAAMEAGLKASGPGNSLLYAADHSNWQDMAALGKEYGAPVAVRADKGDLTALANLAEEVKGAGVEDIVLDPGTRGLGDGLAVLTHLRRLALKKNFRALGYPIITFPGEGANSEAEEAILAAEHIAKYAGFIVLDHFDPASIYPLLTLRQNIYTDPQKPIQVSPGLYEIGEPKPESPLLVTTNFSLTYFTVSGEVEGSGVPSWLLVADAEGMSVLTAWAAGKFDAEKIAKSVKQFGADQRTMHKKIVIPGAVAAISGELEEELPGWEVLVGPREAIDIPAYLRNWN